MSDQNRTSRSRNSQQSRPSTSSELRKLNSRTVSLKAENDSLKVRVAQLEAAFESFATVVPDLRRAVGDIVSTTAGMDSAELALVNQLTLVLNKISLLEDKAGYIDSTNFEILTQLVLVENKIVSLANSFNDVMGARQPGSSMAAKPMTDEEFRGRYIKALTAYQNGQYGSAREQFAVLTQTGMDHELADNAQYWLAECFYSTRNFKRAIDEFEKVMPFRGTDKADDAQYKIGLSYWSAGDYDQAKSAMEKLLAEYPDTNLADQARRYLQ
ncbi:MAG: tetratricopeptide repeat protein [Candidatus Marinimicrobia bacterium]|nr:tetratricopeptide repeat protein [Candidatus Neomarinimicrobiota bacterium]